MKKALSTFMLLCASLSTGMAQRGELRKMHSEVRNEHLEIGTPIGSRLIAAREISIEGKTPSGRALFGTLLIVFDPNSGFYFWQLGVLHDPKYAKLVQLDSAPTYLRAFVDETGITVFGILGNELYVKKNTHKATTMEEAEKNAIREATDTPGCGFRRRKSLIPS